MRADGKRPQGKRPQGKRPQYCDDHSIVTATLLSTSSRNVTRMQDPAAGVMHPPSLMRLTIVLSVVLYAVCGIPVWWATTKLQRPELPHAAMQAVAANVSPHAALLPIILEVYVLLEESGTITPGGLLNALSQQLQESPLALQVISTLEGPDGTCTSSQRGSRTASGGSERHSSNSRGSASCLNLASHTVLDESRGHDIAAAVDAHLHKAVSSNPQRARPGHYTLFVLPDAWPAPAQASSSSIVVGQHRHAWVMYDPSQSSGSAMEDAAASAAALLLKRCFGLKSSAEAVVAAKSLPLSAAAHAVLSFTLLNADPTDGVVAWGDFERFERQFLRPVVDALGPAAHVTVESQVLYYTLARANGTWNDAHEAYILAQQQLPFFIESDWNLESGRAVTAQEVATCTNSMQCDSSRSSSSGSMAMTAAQHAELLQPHVLHFLLYVPPPGQRPLRLLDRSGKQLHSNSFWLPSWGGVIIMNPHELTRAHSEQDGGDSSSSSGSGSSEGGSRVSGGSVTPVNGDAGTGHAWDGDIALDDAAYRRVASIVVSQLHALLGLPLSNIPADGSSRATGGGGSSQLRFLLAPVSGFALWEVEALLRQRTAADVVAASSTLASLSRLVQELPNLEMPDIIGQQVHQSLAAVERAMAAVTLSDYHEASAAAQAARASAEAAFLHPAVLTQLNFPESHKLGIYMPFFLPVSVPVLQGLASELFRCVKQRRQWAAAQRAIL